MQEDESVWDNDEGNYPNLSATDLLIKAAEQIEIDGKTITRLAIIGATDDGTYVRVISNARSYMERSGMTLYAHKICSLTADDDD